MIYNAFFPCAALFQVISRMLWCTRLEVRLQFINHFVLPNRKWRLTSFFFFLGCWTEFPPQSIHWPAVVSERLSRVVPAHSPPYALPAKQRGLWRGVTSRCKVRITRLDNKYRPVLLKRSQCRQLYSNLGGSYSCLILLCCVFPVYVSETKINISHGLLPASE